MVRSNIYKFLNGRGGGREKDSSLNKIKLLAKDVVERNVTVKDVFTDPINPMF